MSSMETQYPPPTPRIRQLIETLRKFDDAIVVARGDGWSVNMCGRVQFGPDGSDPEAVRLADCGCHIHVDWERVVAFTLEDEDVGYGAEPTVVLRDQAGAPVLRIFFPPRLRAELAAELAEDTTEADRPTHTGSMTTRRIATRRVAVVHTSGNALISGAARARQFELLGQLGIELHDVVPAGSPVHGYAQADPWTRATTLADALTDPEMPCVWAAQGGYGATELVPHLRTLLPESLPETTFAGFSDSSFLGTWLALRYPQVRYVHATHALDPMIQNGRRSDLATLVRLLHGLAPAALTGAAQALTDPGPLPIRGPAIPVNLSMAACLPAVIDGLPEGCVLFLEDVDDSMRRLLRCVDVLVASGLTAAVRAIVLGEFTACSDEAGDVLDPNRLGRLVGARTRRPVFVWPEFGHGVKRTPLVLGAATEIYRTAGDETDCTIRLYSSAHP